MKRDLLFDGVLEAEEQARIDNPPPQVWVSVFDIPPGTLTEAAQRSSPEATQLYINSQGNGWWIGGNSWRGTIEYAEENGWTITASYNRYAPFTEVPR